VWIVRWRALQVRAGQVVEQHVVGGVEQVLPAPRQVIEQRPLMGKKKIQAPIQPMDLGQCVTGSQQVGHRAVPVPFPVQPPLTARIDQPIGCQRLEDQIPTRALAAQRQSLRPEPVQFQLVVEAFTPASRRTAVASSTAVAPSSGNSAIICERGTLTSNTSMLLRHASCWLSLISPRYSSGRCTTRPPLTRRFSTKLQYRWTLPSFRRWVDRKNMPAPYPSPHRDDKGVVLDYTPFRVSILHNPLEIPQPPL